jgi:pimeloyl-ACP methyl ester carboxylesterase
LKELYEPLWDELLKASKAHNFNIRGIWIADVVHQGHSAVINEDRLGNDRKSAIYPCIFSSCNGRTILIVSAAWLDHSRDLLHMVNTFRGHMPRPIIGLGHSMGGAQLASLSLLHPRLFETLILIDPVIQRMVSLKGNVSPALASAMRRDRWPSREEAAKSMLRNKFYQAWDKRVFDRWIQHGLRDLPTRLFPEDKATPGPLPAAVSTNLSTTPTPSQPKEVTLRTTKHQEVMTFLRPNFSFREGTDTEPSSSECTIDNPTAINRRTHPDLVPQPVPQTPFYRGESMYIFTQLPHIRPSVLYIFGSLSFLTQDPVEITEKMELTGSGVGGSGGAKEGRVANIMVQGAGHLIPMEKVEESAQHVAQWVGTEMVRFWENERATEGEWGTRKGVERSVLTERYVEELKAATGWKGLQRKGGALKL